MSKQSCLAGSRFLYFLTRYAEETGAGWVYGADMGFRIFKSAPRNVRFADVAYISLVNDPVETFRDEGHCTKVPDVIVESVSPHDNAADAQEKIEDWLDAGVKLVWEVFAELQMVRAHSTRSLSVHRLGDTISAEEILPAFRIAVADLFRKPGVRS